MLLFRVKPPSELAGHEVRATSVLGARVEIRALARQRFGERHWNIMVGLDIEQVTVVTQRSYKPQSEQQKAKRRETLRKNREERENIEVARRARIAARKAAELLQDPPWPMEPAVRWELKRSETLDTTNGAERFSRCIRFYKLDNESAALKLRLTPTTVGQLQNGVMVGAWDKLIEAIRDSDPWRWPR